MLHSDLEARSPAGSAPSIVCAGLACLDIELLSCDTPATRESITKYSGVRHTAGGSAPQTAKALAGIGQSVAAVYPVGNDSHARELETSLTKAGVLVKSILCNRPTALAVLPVFADGGRGCYVSLGANEVVAADSFLQSSVVHANLQAFHFGYPHLIPSVQGKELRGLLDGVRALAASAIISLDVNGADVRDVIEVSEGANESDAGVLVPCLGAVDIIHANLEEACAISGLFDSKGAGNLLKSQVESVVEWFCSAGVRASVPCCVSPAITVAITCGKDGVFVGRSVRNGSTLVVHRPSFVVSSVDKLNTSGGGDSFAAGSLVGMLLSSSKKNEVDATTLSYVGDIGLAAALKTIDRLESGEESFPPVLPVDSLLSTVSNRGRVPSRFCSSAEDV